ncbi:MAG: hypothetical protein AB3N09_11690 [Tateyamaria sp.]
MTGLLPLDQAIFETIVGRYVEQVSARLGLNSSANAPVAVAKLPFQVRSPGYLRHTRLSAVALLVRPATSRPRSDLPSARAVEEIRQDLEIELELSTLGLTTMRHTSYNLHRTRGQYWIDVMGFPKHIVPETDEQRAILDTLLADRPRRQFRYPNVQVGYRPGVSKPLLIDFGGIDLIDCGGWDWLLRAHSCAFEIFQLPTDDFAPFLSRGHEIARALAAALDAERDRLLTALSSLGAVADFDACSRLEELAILIARLAECDTPVDGYINSCVDRMVRTVAS